MYIGVVMVDEFWEVWLCVFEFIYFVICKEGILLTIEKKEAGAIESVFNLKGLLTESKL